MVEAVTGFCAASFSYHSIEGLLKGQHVGCKKKISEREK
jgi:hypothetical protein